MTLNVLLIKNGNVVGMINLNSHRDRAFSPDDITLIYTVASIRFKLLRQGAVSLTSRVLDLRDTENKPIAIRVLLPPPLAPRRDLPSYRTILTPSTLRPTTALPVASQVNLKIYYVAGQLVKSLVDGEDMVPGMHVVRWDCTNNSGERVASGIYFYRMSAGDFHVTGKMVVTKSLLEHQ